MTAAPCSALEPSSKRNPCPICRRSKDGDCRISDGLVLCHYGSSHHPPAGLRIGDVIELSGQQWALTGDTNDGRAAIFTLDKPRHQPTRPVAMRRSVSSSKAAPATLAPIELAELPEPSTEPLAHMPDGQRITYSQSQWVMVTRDASGDKKHKPWHIDADGRNVNRKGAAPWPLWREGDALEYGRGQWIAEAEGEKCAQWFRAAGLVGVSQPGHDHTPASIERRYRRLVEAGVAGVLYLADNDTTGEQKALKCAGAAAAAGLPLVVVPAVEVWPDLPAGGSIDDAPGTAAERADALLAAIPDVMERQRQHQPTAAQRGGAEQARPRDEAAIKGWNQLLAEMLQAVVAGDDDTAMALRADAITRFRLSHAQVDAALFKLHTARELQREVSTPPESLDLSRLSGMDWLVDGFIPDNDQTLLYGAAGTGKTTAALALACAVLRGTGFLDHQHPARSTGVLFIASDSGAAPLYAAMQDMGMADMPEVREGPDKRFHVWAADPDQGMAAWGADLRGCIQLLKFIQQSQIGLVLIDSCKAACSRAGLDYMNNQLVTELLTHFKEAICPHAAVVWLTHDGVARDAHAGAKAWKEIPSMVHMLKTVDGAEGKPSNSQRWWGVMKSRMGPTRQFNYAMNDGQLAPIQGMEIVGNCLARVVDVLMGALQLQGIRSLSRGELQERICMAGGPSRKTLDNTLTTACRARHPEICRVSGRRGHYKLAPRIADSLKGCMLSGKEQGEKPVPDCDLPSSRQVPMGTSGHESEFPRENDGKSPNASGSSGSGQVPSQCACTPTEQWHTRAAELLAEGKHYHSIALALEVESGIKLTGREVKAALA